MCVIRFVENLISTKDRSLIKKKETDVANHDVKIIIIINEKRRVIASWKNTSIDAKKNSNRSKFCLLQMSYFLNVSE